MPWETFEDLDEQNDIQFPEYATTAMVSPKANWFTIREQDEFSTVEDEDGCLLVDKRIGWSLPELAVGPIENQESEFREEKIQPPLTIKVLSPRPSTSMFVQEARNTLQLGYNCFDVAIGIARETLIQFALDHKEDLEYRQLLAQEIKTAAMMTATLMNMQEDLATKGQPINPHRSIDLVEAFALLDTAQKYGTKEDIQRLSLQIQEQLAINERPCPLDGLRKLALPSDMHTKALQRLVNFYNVANDAIKPMIISCNELLGYKEGMRLNFEELRAFFSNPVHFQKHSEALGQFNQALKSLKPHEDALQSYCESEQVYVDYVKMQYGQKQWLAFIPNTSGKYNTSMVDIAARCLNKQIIIYHLVANAYEEQYRTEFLGTGKLFIAFTGNHFIALKCNPDYMKGLHTELASHGFFKPQSNASLKKLEDPAHIVVEYLC